MRGHLFFFCFLQTKKPTITERWLKQSMNQINASEGRPITWLFSNQMDADYAEKIFLAADAGRERIDIDVLPWDRMRKWWIGITI
jgi:hypothetical protein